ncbi:MAG: hypothetical protein GX434_07720 [Peptococcaceae bacterium]|nr:hypothetical protein [Peptococcaceae bacterium]
MRKIIRVSVLVICFLLFTGSVFAAVNETTRLFGSDRFKTAKVIAEHYNNGLVDNVVLAPGTNFANALAASVLAYKKEAPLLLLGSTAENTKEAFDYITNHLTKIGTIYLVGDSDLIGSDFESKLNQLGYKNIVQIKGKDKYETDYLIAKELEILPGTPVVISSGENFPDALAISSFAAANGWPILLAQQSYVTPELAEFIKEKQPSRIYITGGTNVIGTQVEEKAKNLAPFANIKRFSGYDRYNTAIQIANEFAPGSLEIYISSGLNYPDALAGSVLAAKSNSPIILVNPASKTLPQETVDYLNKFKRFKSNIRMIFIGGTSVISTELEVLAAKEGGYVADSLKVQEDEVISLVNQERTSRGLWELTQNEVLSRLARLKSQDMADKGYFDHQSPTYGSPFDMMKSFGIIYSYAGENIAYGQPTAQMVMQGWMNSSGHQANILKPEFTEIGVGIAKDSSGRLYWTQMFIKP